MIAGTATVSLSWRVFGLGVMALGALSLAWGDFVPGQSIPKTFSERALLAYAAGAIMLVAGAALEWRRTVAWGAAVLTAYYALVVVILMNGRLVVAHYTEFGTYSGVAEQVAIAAAGLIVYAASARINTARAARLTRAGQAIFAGCAVLFGGAHFFYMNMTAPLLPTWLPPSQEFWGYATGVFHIAAGIAILANVKARFAAILLTVMYAAFTPLVHLPMLLADTANRYILSENVLNIVLVGVAWVVADSLARQKRW